MLAIYGGFLIKLDHLLGGEILSATFNTSQVLGLNLRRQMDAVAVKQARGTNIEDVQ